MLVDFLHHVRLHFTPQQLARVVHTYGVLFNDTGFPLSVQTVMGRLLTNMYDAIDKLQDKAEGMLRNAELFWKFPTKSQLARKLLLRIIDAIATKLHVLRITEPIATKFQQKRKTHGPLPSATELYSGIPEFDGFLDLGYVQPIRTSTKAFENSLDVLKGIWFFAQIVCGRWL